MTPTIFGLAMDLQGAIINDQVIEKVILSKDDYLMATASKDKIGYMIGTNILQGFWNPNPSTKGLSLRNYKDAIKNYDPSAAPDINSGKILGMGEYDYNYFPILSTVVLGYTLYLIVKFCIDVALRGFKLGFLQMMAPIAIVDYITGGPEEGAFKNWLKACKGTYLMLFIRVISLWFVVFVTTLMNKTGNTKESLLYIPKGGEPDYLLRAVIVIALLAFMMELPKLLSEIFGLDLEGDATVKGLMKSVAGGFKTVAGVGLAAGGAALGGMFGAAKGVSKGIANRDHKQVLGALGGNAGGILKAGLGQTRFGGALVGGMSSGYGSSQKASAEEHAKTKEQQAKQQAADERRQDIERQETYRRQDNEYRKQDVARQEANRNQDIMRDNVKSQISNNPRAANQDMDSYKQTIIDSVSSQQISAKLDGIDIGALTTDIHGRLVGIDGISQPQEVIQHVQQALANKLDVKPEATTQIVNQVLGNSNTATEQQINQIVNKVVQVAKDNTTTEVTQVVNQVMGNVVSSDAGTATRTVNEVQGSTVTSQENSSTHTIKFKAENDVPESLFDGDSGVVKRTNSSESKPLLDTNREDS